MTTVGLWRTTLEPSGPPRPTPVDRPKMLELPQPGHKVARRWWWAGIIAYGMLSSALVGALLTSGGMSLLSLFGIGTRINWAILVLVGTGVALTIAAAARAWKDIRVMAREEIDVDWVHRTGKPGLLLVFADPGKREKMLGQPFDLAEHEMTVETLMDDRVRRVRRASIDPDAGAVVPDDLKGVAEVRTAQLGSFARYASSLLLLLAVLGTFAGVKTALPGLIDSITASTANAGAVTAANEGLIKSLKAISEAFGGNALALIGAIAIGLMAQGVGFGRRNLLERLELVSSEFLYGQNVTADANPMHAAMVALRDTAREMHSASGAMLGIEDQLQALGQEFRSAFDSLANRMHDIATGQEEALYANTSESLDTLHQRVGDLAESVEANARTYAGLAEAVKVRSQEAGNAFESMAESNRQLAIALESIVTTGERSRVTMGELAAAATHVRQSSDQVAVEVQRVAMASEAISPMIQRFESALTSSDIRFADAERAARDEWKAMASLIATRLESLGTEWKERPERMERAERPAPSAPPSAGVLAQVAPDPQTVRLLQSIATGIEQLRSERAPRLWHTAIGPLVGVAVGSSLVALLARLL